jgi:hypothetical protein
LARLKDCSLVAEIPFSPALVSDATSRSPWSKTLIRIKLVRLLAFVVSASFKRPFAFSSSITPMWAVESNRRALAS